MKAILKGLGVLLGIAAGLLLIGFLIVITRGVPSYKTKEVTFVNNNSPERVEEGIRLAAMVCANCHAGPDGRLTGGKMLDLEPSFGIAYAPNITDHKEFGAGRYSDSELAYLLRTGVKKDGGYAPPWMPKFPNMAEVDMQAIIAYLRSDHWTVEASDIQQPPSEPSLLTKFLCNVAFKPLPYPKHPIALPDTTDLVAYGKYMATAKVDCYQCHSANFKTNRMLHPEKSSGFMGGGNILLEPQGNAVRSANITMDQATGIGLWRKEEFVDAVKRGKRPDGTVLSVAMPKFTVMEDWEIMAIWEYLRTIPEIENTIARD